MGDFLPSQLDAGDVSDLIAVAIEEIAMDVDALNGGISVFIDRSITHGFRGKCLTPNLSDWVQ